MTNWRKGSEAYSNSQANPGLERVRRASIEPRISVFGGETNESNYLSFEWVLAVLWRQRKAVLLSLLAGAAIAAVSYAMQSKVYRARTTLEIQMPNGDYLNHRQLDQNVEPGALLMEPFLQTQLRLLQSDTMLMRVVKKLELSEDPEFRLKPTFLNPGESQPPKAGSGPLLEAVRARLDARMLGQTQIVEISFEAREPKLAARFVNTLAAEYQNLAISRQVESVNQTGDVLSGQLEAVRGSLKAAERLLQDYVSTSGLLSGGDKDSVAEQRLKQVQGVLTAAEDARISDQARYEGARAASGPNGGDLVESDTLRGYRVRMTELRQQLAEASEVLQPAHYKVRQLKAELAEVEQAFEREREGTLRRLGGAYQASRAREQALLADYNQQVNRASQQMTNSVRYTTLKRDVETQQQLYDSMIQRTKEASVLSAMRTSNVKVVDPADIPYRAVRPQKSLYAALGLTAGSLFGLLIAFGRERRASRVARQKSDSPPGLRSLGVIPHFLRAIATEEPETAVWTSPESSFSHVIEGASHFLVPLASGPRVVGITSPNIGEGKTTVACNLAVEVARSGRTVLLIDADHCSPRLHEVFRIGNNVRGFSEMARAGAGSASGLDSIWVTRIPNLAVLPCGKNSLNAGHDHVPAAITRLRSEFDVLVFDLPAVLASDSAARVAACLDSVALVVSADRTTAKGVETAVRRLALERAPLVGALFNRVKTSPTSKRLLASPTFQ